jgi:H+/Cl- antiporter ClcA/PII-like signaling protein
MLSRWNLREHFSLGGYVVRWVLLAAPIGAAVGSACAFFLWALGSVTELRFREPWLLLLLPVGGVLVGALYRWVGKQAEGGNNLIMDEIHEPGAGVPARMGPLVLLGTIVTHLFGGSAGREGTALQLGGSIASAYARLLGRLGFAVKLRAEDTRTLLMAGVAAGFGGVFGTPLTGAIFALEVLAIGRMSYESVVPCLIASVVADWACGAWGIEHTQYRVASLLAGSGEAWHIDWLLLAKVALASTAFGLASVVFAELTHGLGRLFKRAIPWPVVRPMLGGVLVIGLAYLLGTRDYLGLGVTSPDPDAVTVLSSFTAGGAHPWSWWWKLLFTALTLSAGFKGGEVTPLFFIGAALGNTLGTLLGAPVDLFAALGFVAVFAGATNTPLACTIMGVELFGPQHVVYVAVACFLSYILSGHSGIYLSQRIATPKVLDSLIPPDVSLGMAHDMRPAAAPILIPSLSTLAGRVGLRRDRSRVLLNGGPDMSLRHRIHSDEIGVVRIYMRPREKRNKQGFKAFFGRPLYQEIIDAAKQEGIINAVAHHTHYGYTKKGRIEADNVSETPNTNINIFVELIDQRETLEGFCRKHGEFLQGRVVVYKHVEHWEFHDNTLTSTDATIRELKLVKPDEPSRAEAVAV